MAIYEYRCPKCGHEQEARLPWTQASLEQRCGRCGEITERRVSLPAPAIVQMRGRDKVLHTLNREHGYGLPESDRPRYEQLISKELDNTRPVIGVGI